MELRLEKMAFMSCWWFKGMKQDAGDDRMRMVESISLHHIFYYYFTQLFSNALPTSTSRKQLGAQEPLGFYDPLGLLNEADEARFQRLRYVELKHGRIAQLAFLGQIVTRAGIHLPGNIDLSGNSFDSFPDGLAAISGPDAIPQAGLGQIVLFVGLLELFVMKDGKWFILAHVRSVLERYFA
jgi:hypothetical protein